jgi:hypothetical protein
MARLGEPWNFAEERAFIMQRVRSRKRKPGRSAGLSIVGLPFCKTFVMLVDPGNSLGPKEE